MMMYEDYYTNEIVSKPIEEIEQVSLKLKFDIVNKVGEDEISVHKFTIRGYDVVIKFERIKGTNLFRMTSSSKCAQKTFDKLYKALK